MKNFRAKSWQKNVRASTDFPRKKLAKKSQGVDRFFAQKAGKKNPRKRQISRAKQWWKKLVPATPFWRTNRVKKDQANKRQCSRAGGVKKIRTHRGQPPKIGKNQPAPRMSLSRHGAAPKSAHRPHLPKWALRAQFSSRDAAQRYFEVALFYKVAEFGLWELLVFYDGLPRLRWRKRVVENITKLEACRCDPCFSKFFSYWPRDLWDQSELDTGSYHKIATLFHYVLKPSPHIIF